MIRAELAVAVAEEISSTDSISDLCKVLALWLVLSEYTTEAPIVGEKGPIRRKAYYKHFIPLLEQGTKSCKSLTGTNNEQTATGSDAKALLIQDTWAKLCKSLSRMLAPVTSSSGLLKISRASELMDIMQILLENVPSDFSEELCTVMSRGASYSLKIEKENRSKSVANSESELSEGEFNKMRSKYREDALQVFKSCYSAVCAKEADNPALLSLTDQALSDALVAVKETEDDDDNDVSKRTSVDSFLMVCEALRENPGVEGLIVSSFPLLCKLVQTKHEMVRNAAAAALGAADVRQVLSGARDRYKRAEQQAIQAEKQISDLKAAVEALQQKNEELQRQVALSTLHIS